MSEARYTTGEILATTMPPSGHGVMWPAIYSGKQLYALVNDSDEVNDVARILNSHADLLAALVQLYDATTDGRRELIQEARAVARKAMGKAEQQQPPEGKR